ncbi:MAG: NTP transferase domain-containing protein, partial [Planctomycetes bacterium]|nr:NTP transferase domain-containing protein [Planctomycetota bacterium]
MIFALVPAAGHSTRMSRPKLALPLGGRTVLEHVIAALRGGGAEHILVVIGPHVTELGPLADMAGAETLLLSEETADMRATVEAGLTWLEAKFSPKPDDAWLLAPADHPTLNAAVVQQLVAARIDIPESSIIIPTFAGRRGDPALIAWQHIEG